MKKLFTYSELADMLTVCNSRQRLINSPCRCCSYFLTCDKMYAYITSLDDEEVEKIDNIVDKVMK